MLVCLVVGLFVILVWLFNVFVYCVVCVVCVVVGLLCCCFLFVGLCVCWCDCRLVYLLMCFWLLFCRYMACLLVCVDCLLVCFMFGISVFW